jgi:predicted SAM-dependent methyltransferase
VDRLEYQRYHVAKTAGKVLNIASKEDPASLKVNFGDRIINCDISNIDTDSGRPISIDVLMDCREVWPFEDDSAELVVMAEILEHLYIEEAIAALEEAYRVAPKLVVTLPYDFTIPLDYKGPEVTYYDSGARSHVSGWNKTSMMLLLETVGYVIKEWETIDYGQMGTERLDGFLIYCERN